MKASASQLLVLMETSPSFRKVKLFSTERAHTVLVFLGRNNGGRGADMNGNISPHPALLPTKGTSVPLGEGTF